MNTSLLIFIQFRFLVKNLEVHVLFAGHSSIIQVMSRKGIYVVDDNDKAVTESVLIKSAPFDVVGENYFNLVNRYKYEVFNLI